MKHIILTGERRAGKSTLARRIVDALGVEPGGFVTRLDDRERRDRTLLIGDGRDMRPAAAFSGGYPSEVFADVFDGYGRELLARPARLILMDELGRLEGRAAAFRAAVLARLDGDVPVLAVARRLDRASWLDDVLGHPNARVVLVTPENRDALLPELAAHFAGEMRSMP